MAKLPYTYTICPPGPEPKQFTASCTQMGQLLKDSPNGDLTIDQRRGGAWQSWDGRRLEIAPLEEIVSEMCKKD
jgi:hypothetical protein